MVVQQTHTNLYEPLYASRQVGLSLHQYIQCRKVVSSRLRGNERTLVQRRSNAEQNAILKVLRFTLPLAIASQTIFIKALITGIKLGVHLTRKLCYAQDCSRSSDAFQNVSTQISSSQVDITKIKDSFFTLRIEFLSLLPFFCSSSGLLSMSVIGSLWT